MKRFEIPQNYSELHWIPNKSGLPSGLGLGLAARQARSQLRSLRLGLGAPGQVGVLAQSQVRPSKTFQCKKIQNNVGDVYVFHYNSCISW